MQKVGTDAPRGSRRAERQEARRRERARRHRIATEVADQHGGVALLSDLLAAGLTRDHVRAEIEAGAWRKAGVHTVHISGGTPTEKARWWRALWEVGSRAVLDGETALLAAGLKGWDSDMVHVSVPNSSRPRVVSGVKVHYLRDLGPTIDPGLRRTRPDVAVIRAAQWARTDRQAATLVAMTVQQRLVRPEDVLDRWGRTAQSPRREFLETVIRDVCAGAQALSELDFAAACRERGLPEPSRQALRKGRSRSVYLDVLWEDLGLHVEIHGAHHASGLAPVEDALRSNDVQLDGHAQITLQIPLLGLRLRKDDYLDQVERALGLLRAEKPPSGNQGCSTPKPSSANSTSARTMR